MSQVTSHKSQVTRHKAKRQIRGFTLIEMMVVIGIIAILSAVVVPGFKKVYGDFKILETYDKIDIMLSAIRSFRLIRNDNQIEEFCEIYGDKKAVPFFPNNCVNSSQYTGTGVADPSKYCQGFSEHFAKLYMFSEVSIRIGYSRNTVDLLYCERPYYCDDLRSRYKQKGCTIFKIPSSEGISIFPPESSSHNTFQ